MLRVVLTAVLTILIVRAFWRLVEGFMEGLSGPRRSGVPERGVRMVRDPVCGTFVLPERAVMIRDGSRSVFFCSAGCRDKYRARTA
jgi:YHS domain-containing protein